MTGGTGFLGSALLRSLADRDTELVVLKRSTSDCSRLAGLEGRVRLVDLDRTRLADVFDGHSFDAIVHCATNYGRADVPPTEIVEANLTLPLRLLQLAHERGVRTFVNSDTILDKRVNHYSLSKAQFVDWLGEYADRLTCINVALEHFYGPGDDPSKFVTQVLRALLRGEPVIEFTPGEQRRDFVYIDDVVQAFVTVLDRLAGRPNGLHRVEIGSGQSVRIVDFVRLAQRLAGGEGTRLVFGALDYRPHEVMESRADLAVLSQLGWVPCVTLEDGLRSTIEGERRLL